MHSRDERDGGGVDRGVSQVIAIVLLLAITVLLVGVVGVYVTDFGDQVRQPAPTFSSTTEFADRYDPHGQYLNVTHGSGDTLETATLRLDVNGAEWTKPTGASGEATLESGVIQSQVGDEFTSSETLSIERRHFTDAGGTPLEDAGKHVELGDATVRIVYEPPDADRSEPVYTCHVAFPDCESAPS